MTDRSTAHATFTIERDLAYPPARVFAAFASQAAKARWFIGPEESARTDHALDFRDRGDEHLATRLPDGTLITFDATYRDIVPDERIIYAYDMHMGDRRISVSLACIELRPAGGGTHLTLREHGIFLDGLDQVADRERGTQELLDKLEASLTADPTGVA
jgi:uncharacterized protein YndB with AHSA1/START domain